MKIIKTLLFLVIIHDVYAQTDVTIKFKEPLKVIANERISADIKKNTPLSLTAVTSNNSAGIPAVLYVRAKTIEGSEVEFEAKKIIDFEFKEISNIEQVWNKSFLINNTYSNIVIKGYQYELRNDMNNDAIEYINKLETNDRFFNDEYFEDYLYTLANKIHTGLLKDKRPGNLFIKIVKEIQPNAFVLPNGCIVISTGLLSPIQSEDELVGILAHEIAHFALDHHILSYNKEIDRKKRAEFWATFATIIAAASDTYLAVKNNNYVPGILTASSAILATAFSDEVITRLGLKYNQSQEIEADKVAKEILETLKYNKLGLSVALKRIKDYCILTGNYLALTGNGSHPSLDYRINLLGAINNLDTFTQSSFLKKISLINSYNAQLELWYYSHYVAASDLAQRNIANGVATESDYLVEAVVKKRLLNTKESNEEVLNLLTKAKNLNINSFLVLHKEEGIIYLRLNKKNEAKKSFQTYLLGLNNLEDTQNKFVENEKDWTKKMIYKIDSL